MRAIPLEQHWKPCRPASGPGASGLEAEAVLGKQAMASRKNKGSSGRRPGGQDRVKARKNPPTARR